MLVANLRLHLPELAKIPDAEWMASLDDHKRRELQFHDRDRDRQKITQLDQDTHERFYGNKKYYIATEASKRYVDGWDRDPAVSWRAEQNV